MDIVALLLALLAFVMATGNSIRVSKLEAERVNRIHANRNLQ